MLCVNIYAADCFISSGRWGLRWRQVDCVLWIPFGSVGDRQRDEEGLGLAMALGPVSTGQHRSEVSVTTRGQGDPQALDPRPLGERMGGRCCEAGRYAAVRQGGLEKTSVDAGASRRSCRSGLERFVNVKCRQGVSVSSSLSQFSQQNETIKRCLQEYTSAYETYSLRLRKLDSSKLNSFI